MSSQHVLQKGENLLLVRSLLGADGVTPLLVSAVASLKVELFVETKLFGTYILGSNAELRAHGTSGVELEVTAAMSSAMPSGRLREKWTIQTNDTAFVVGDSKRVDLIELSEVLIR